MKKEILDNELILGMEQELKKTANNSFNVPNLSKAAEYLHNALEIFEEQGLYKKADQILQLLNKINQTSRHNIPPKTASISITLQQLMEAGISQRDLREFSKKNPYAVAKVNLICRSLGLSDNELNKFLGHDNFMSKEKALNTLNPNSSVGLMKEEPEYLEFKSIAKKKVDPATKGLTVKKQIQNLKEYGFPLNKTMADDGADLNFAEFLNNSDFNFDDDLMDMEVEMDTLEVSDQDLDNFEDEKS